MNPTHELPLSEAAPTGCTCGHHATEVPELDARTIPHEVRHAAILGALGGIPVGGAMDLVAPHDPKPLLAQIADRDGDAIEVTYLETGPDAWTLRLTRTR